MKTIEELEEEWEDLPNSMYVANLCISQVTKVLDSFISECMEGENPKCPSKKALMSTRGYLPEWCKNTLIKEKT